MFHTIFLIGNDCMKIHIFHTSENIDINIKGRHDPIIVPRAVVVVESMVAVTIVDLLFQSMTSRMDNIIKFFK